MKCKKCRQTIVAQDVPRAHTDKDVLTGKPLGVYHYKCWALIERARRNESRYLKDAPGAYDVTRGNKDDIALAQRQAELAEDRAIEDNRSGFRDWRSPDEVEF